MSIFGQVWLWSVAAFVVGALVSWVVLARPAQARNRVLERQLLDAKNVSAPERQPSATRTFDREQEFGSDIRSLNSGSAAPTQVTPQAERGDDAVRTTWYERDSFAGSASGQAGGSFGSVLEPESDAERTTYFAADSQSDLNALLGGSAESEQPTRFEDQYGNATAAGLDSASQVESDRPDPYAGRLDQGGLFGGSPDESGGRVEERPGQGQSYGDDLSGRQGQRYGEQSDVEPESSFGGAGSGREQQFSGFENRGRTHGDESQDEARRFSDERDELIQRLSGDSSGRGFAGGPEEREPAADDQLAAHGQRPADEGFEPWGRRSAEEGFELHGRQLEREDFGQQAADESAGAHGLRSFDEQERSFGGESGGGHAAEPAGRGSLFAGDPAEPRAYERGDTGSEGDDSGRPLTPESGESKHSRSNEPEKSTLDELPRRIPGGHRRRADESAVDGEGTQFVRRQGETSGSLFDAGPGQAQRPESAAGSLFDGSASSGRGSLFEPGALPDSEGQSGAAPERGAHAAGDAWAQPFSGLGAADEQPPAYAFSQDVQPEPPTEDQATESTAVLPKRQPRSTPRSSFEPPRPSMRSIERREPTQQAGEGGRSGSLFEPTVQRTSGGATAAPDFEAPPTPPARSSSPESSSVPPGPFGPGSAMPRPGGARPSDDFAVKASVTALRYCTEESPQFERMVAEVWFRSAEDAERVGFRPLS